MKGVEIKTPESWNPGILEPYFHINKGFTLLELIVVIFIISLMLAVSFPYFTVSEAGKLKSEAARIASVLRYLNDSAVSTKETVAVKFDLRQKTVSYKGPDGEKVERIDDLSDVSLQSRGRVSDGEVIVFFTPTGASESFIIHLRSEDSAIAVSSNSLNGRVRVQPQEV
ncbi:MAG: prepilin-type N-terminal cleavage/methylation domain-containing protein [Syntrophales bacterium]|nr:prepilin-type N-terminal cleavage/methylation domain-containing protein [Syntrophales bacterium]